MTLNILWSNVIKIASFSKKLHKIAQRLGFRPYTPVSDMFKLHYIAQYVYKIHTFPLFTLVLSLLPIANLVMCQTQATASDLPIFNIFVPQKVFLSKICDDVIACNILATPMA